MKKILLVTLLTCSAFAIMQSCRKTETTADADAAAVEALYEQELQADIEAYKAARINDVPDLNLVEDRANYTLGLSAANTTNWGSTADYIRVTYTNASNVVTTATVRETGPLSTTFTVKGGTTMDIKHRMTHNSADQFNVIGDLVHATSGCSSTNSLSFNYVYRAPNNGSTISYVCNAVKVDGANCTFSGITCPCCVNPYSVCN